MKLAKLHLNTISEHIAPDAMKDFIISDKPRTIPILSNDYPFILDGVAFAVCTKGIGKIRINFREYDLKENTIISILPHYIIEFLYKSPDLEIQFLIFSIDFLSGMPSQSNFDIIKGFIKYSCLETSKEEIEQLLEFHSFIVKQYKRKENPFRHDIIKALLYSCLIELAGIYYRKLAKEGENPDLEASSRQEEIMYKFFQLLLLHHKEHKSLEFYANKLCLTPKYLSTLLKERTGRTAFTWINEAIIGSAKYMLKTSDKTIAQLSEELNFPNPSFFGRFFKKHTGMTPLQYRDNKNTEMAY